MILDHWVAMLSAPLGFWVLCNGLDDLVIDVCWCISSVVGLFRRGPRQRLPSEEELDATPVRRIAVFVALWQEDGVIREMIQNNIAKVRYPLADFFIGVYPNDTATIAGVREAAKRFPNVHLAIAPNPGPTTKADNLNSIYRAMLLHESRRGCRFDTILTHDAEDLMDPDSLRLINYYAQWYDMVQVPVLALKTGLREMAHGTYCDDFAESQIRELPTRQRLGGFLPSCGVGTGFSRDALERIAAAQNGEVFRAVCLTEDYENGWRIHNMGLKQKFIPVHFPSQRPRATREYFARTFRQAIDQKGRWILGITLQSWEFHSAAETFRQIYWFWRDRKGLVGNLLTPLMNALALYGVTTWVWDRAFRLPWTLARELAPFSPVYSAGLVLLIWRLLIRCGCSARVYGWKFGLAAIPRVFTGNWINGIATVRAIAQFVHAKRRGLPLKWKKTAHLYPKRTERPGEIRTSEKRPLSELLTSLQWITPVQLETARQSRPTELRLGEHLIRVGLITEANLYNALSIQNDLPFAKPAPELFSPHIARALPLSLVRKWKMVPIRVTGGKLCLAGAEIPDEEMRNEIKKFSSLHVSYQLVTPTEFGEISRRWLV